MPLLDAKDKKILSCLLKDCRQTNTQIAKKCGLSREVVSYRINQLEKEGIITGYTSDINFNNLGYIAYSLGLVLKNISKEKLTILKERDRIAYLQTTLGKFDLTCTILLKNLKDLKDEYDFIVSLFQNDLIEINSDIFIGDIDFSANIFEAQNVELNFLPQNITQITDSDKRILKELIINSRQTIVELHQKLSISVPTIAKSIKKLKKKKIILANRVLLDFNKLDLHRYTVLIFANPKLEKQLIQYCKQNKKIWDIGKYSGTYNYIIEIFAKNNDEFESVVKSIKECFKESIFRTEILLVSLELKHKYFYI